MVSEVKKKYKKVLEIMEKYEQFGAQDLEGYNALYVVEDAVRNTKPFPLTGINPFDLYESERGWQTANADLVSAARGYWVEGVRTALGLEKE